MKGRFYALYDGADHATVATCTATAGWSLSSSVSLNYGLDLSRGTWALASILMPNGKPLSQKDSGGTVRSLLGLSAADAMILGDATHNIFADAGSGGSFVPNNDNSSHLGGPSNRWADVSLVAGKFYGSSSGVITVQAAAAAGTNTITLPAATGTVALTAGATIPTLATGDILYASAANTLSALADVATGNALISGGVGVAPSWGKVGISTHVSGLGTNVATALGTNVGLAGAFAVVNGVLGSPSSVGTMPAFTLGGTISGGGNQINNVIIGTTTPLAGTFSSVALAGSSSGSITLSAPAAAGSNTIKFPAGSTDFTATGGASFFLKQNGAGAAITVVQPSASDLSNGVSGTGPVLLQTNGVAAGLGKVAPWQGGYVATRYYIGAIGNIIGTIALSVNTAYYCPIQIGETHTFDRIAAQITATGTATNIRLAIYNAAGGVPTSLVVDGGNVAAGSTGLKTVTISQSLNPGAYFLAVVADGTVTITADNSAGQSIAMLNGITDFVTIDSQMNGALTFGAFPSTAGAPSYSNANSPAIGLRA